jgi:hypothetical protein
VPLSQSRVLSGAPDETLCQPKARVEQHPKHWPQHEKDDGDAHQAHQQSLMVDGMPVAHGAEYGEFRV